MRFRPLVRPLKAPRRARLAASMSLMTLIAGVVLAGSGLVTLQGALASLGLAAILAVVAIGLASYALNYIWTHTGIGVGDALLALSWAFPVIVAVSMLTYVVTQTPSYPDLATDVDNPPSFTVLAQEREADNPLPLDAASPAERIRLQLAYPDITTSYIERPGWHVAEVLEALIRSSGWDLARLETDDGLYFEAEFSVRGRLLLVNHAVAVRSVDDGEGSTVDARALSSLPLHDFGTNGPFLDSVVQRILRAIEATPPPASDL